MRHVEPTKDLPQSPCKDPTKESTAGLTNESTNNRTKEPTTVSIGYGKDQVSFSTTERCTVYLPNHSPEIDPDAVILQSLANPMDSSSLSDFIDGTRSLLLIVNDATRPSLTPLILKSLLLHIEDHAQLNVLLATGTHPIPDQSSLERIFGETLERLRSRILFHDSRDDSSLTFVGKTSRGTNVRLNKEVLTADGIICIGNVKPHYFAGFAGGRKSFLPGLAGFGTVEQNHAHACDPRSQPMRLSGNPVAEDLEEGLRFLDGTRIFSIQTVLDHEHRLVGCFCGDLERSFIEATKLARMIYGINVLNRGNLVITANPYPMDINLYQSQHALENIRSIVEPGGIVILVSRCWDGIGNPAYLEALDEARRFVLTEMLERHSGLGYNLGDHKAIRFLQMSEQFDIWALTDLDDTTIMRSRMRPIHNLQKAVDEAAQILQRRGKEPCIMVFPKGGLTVPSFISP